MALLSLHQVSDHTCACVLQEGCTAAEQSEVDVLLRYVQAPGALVREASLRVSDDCLQSSYALANKLFAA